MKSEQRPPLVVILGPTAVGKTEVSIQLAERLNGEIVSADSRLFYRGMDIGTAKPGPEELARVRHHLVDIADPDEAWSLARFQQAAEQAIAGIHARGRLPFLVGGTGQYVRAVIEGWQPPQVAPDPHLRRALEQWGNEVGAEGLHQRLSVLDPKAAEKIDYRNSRRTVRALEVILSTGQRFSDQRRKAESPYNRLMVGLTRPREELYARLDARIEKMLAEGLVDEVRGLMEKGYSPELPAFSAIGYREIIDHLQGKTSLDEAVELIKKNTRTFVRRQANWFKAGDPEIHWFRAHPQVAGEIETLISSWQNRGFLS